MNPQNNNSTLLEGISTDTIFKDKQKKWHESNWRIRVESVKNLEESIKKGKIKKHPDN